MEARCQFEAKSFVDKQQVRSRRVQCVLMLVFADHYADDCPRLRHRIRIVYGEESSLKTRRGTFFLKVLSSNREWRVGVGCHRGGPGGRPLLLQKLAWLQPIWHLRFAFAKRCYHVVRTTSTDAFMDGHHEIGWRRLFMNLRCSFARRRQVQSACCSRRPNIQKESTLWVKSENPCHDGCEQHDAMSMCMM